MWGGSNVIAVTMTNRQQSDGLVDMPIYGNTNDIPACEIRTFSVGQTVNVWLAAIYDGKAVLNGLLFGARDVYVDEASTGIEKITDEESDYFGDYIVEDGANIVFYASY